MAEAHLGSKSVRELPTPPLLATGALEGGSTVVRPIVELLVVAASGGVVGTLVATADVGVLAAVVVVLLATLAEPGIDVVATGAAVVTGVWVVGTAVEDVTPASEWA